MLCLLVLAAVCLVEPPPRLVVVAPAAWESALKPFLEERGRTLTVEFVAIEDVVASEGTDPESVAPESTAPESTAPESTTADRQADAPEKLKRFLYRAWRERDARYVLLVGDADTLPVRFMVLDRKTEAAHDYAFYASDLYYADVADAEGAFDDWNATAEGFHADYFGEVRGEAIKDSPINYDRVSYVPELAVGRWPVSTREELVAVAAKTLAHEPSETAPKALFVHADGWIDARPRVRAMGAELAASGFSCDYQLYGEREGVPSTASVRAALLAGVALAVHVGHGSNESWHGCLGPADRVALEAAPAAVYISIGCSTGHFCSEPPYHAYLDDAGRLHKGTDGGEVFDAPPPPPAALQPGRFNSTGLGERLVRSPRGGALVYIGCNTGAQPCALSLLEGFTANLAPGVRVGDAWRAALEHYWSAERLDELVPSDSWYPPSIFFQGMKFMFFGDPTLVVGGR